MEICLFGRFAIREGGEELPAPGRLVRTLLGVLLVNRGTFVSRDVLIDALWPRDPPADPAANLKVLVNRARSLLGNRNLVLTGSAGYSFAETPDCRLDTELFLEHLKLGATELAADRCVSAAEHLERAIALRRGEPLAEESYEEWAAEYRERLDGWYMEALESGSIASLRAGRPAQAVRFAQIAARREPLRESCHLLLARALRAAGDTAAALDVIGDLQRRLSVELGLDLSPVGEELQLRLLNQQGEPSPPGQRVQAPPAARLPFAGRRQVLRELLAHFSRGEAAVAAVTGPPGAGKSRLLREFAGRLGRPVVSARAFQAGRENSWSLGSALLHNLLAEFPQAAGALHERFAEALAEVVPELGVPEGAPRSPMGAESRRALALQGAVSLCQAAVSQEALFVVDDLQWADPTSLQLLNLLVQRLSELGIVLAYRTADRTTLQSQAIAELLAQSPVPALVLRLDGLRADELQELFDDELTQLLVRTTAGEPFGVEQMLRSMAGEGVVERGPDGRWRPVDDRSRAAAAEIIARGRRRALIQRIRSLHPVSRQVVDILSLIGRQASARLIARSLGREPQQVLQHLEELSAAGLASLGKRGWGLTHDLIAQAVADEMSPAEHARTSGMLASALAGSEGDPAEVARHLLGAGDPATASVMFAEGSRLSLDRFANEEAESIADEGLEGDPALETRASLLETRAEARFRRGALEDARRDLRAAIRARQPGPSRALTLARLAMLSSGSQDYRHATELIELSLVEAGEDPAAKAEALTIAANFDLNLGRIEIMRQREDEALSLFQKAGNSAGVVRVLENRAFYHLVAGRFIEAEGELDRVARTFEDSGEVLRVASPRCARGLTLAWMNRPTEGLADIDEALELARLVGGRELEAHVLWFRSQVLCALGQANEAIGAAELTLAIGREIGHRELTVTGLIGLGSALHTSKRLDEARSHLVQALQMAHDMPIFLSAAAVRLAPVLIDLGELDEAEEQLRTVMAGPEMTRFEGRLQLARLAFRRGDPHAADLATEALALARQAGHFSSAAALEQLVAAGT